jgi:HTH-type transcriptional regulator / antitoxin HipB
MEKPILTFSQLAQGLKALRKEKRLTQAEAASRVGMLAKTLSRLESDPGSASIESLFKLLSALDSELVIRPKNRGAKPRGGEW